MDPISVFSIASRQAEFLSVRQTAVASNIANADVSTYKARDTQSFASVLANQEVGLARTNGRHIGAADQFDGIRINTTDDHVALEKELVKSTEVKTAMQMNTAIVSSFHRMFLMAVQK